MGLLLLVSFASGCSKSNSEEDKRTQLREQKECLISKIGAQANLLVRELKKSPDHKNLPDPGVVADILKLSFAGACGVLERRELRDEDKLEKISVTLNRGQEMSCGQKKQFHEMMLFLANPGVTHNEIEELEKNLIPEVVQPQFRSIMGDILKLAQTMKKVRELN